ncbi:histidine phosphatase family protein [Flavobacteriaceae bacterium S0825]|uniref:SixA phosphatase family protein n=1 Tax=Gaetbulibacter sp. S0825 TaxID=2720084 RepID=UPI001430DA91|nr:phosphoglycerate mutase family protein [Gaetbulibacter sp. S0825]MCK0109208.1 histidine phosphatase family protein [Flavobacteriaceae bacterium S0825]NIX64843.1 histidine phosphatase family protein [Gaetbulibacter sp. S0825]
MKRLIILCIVLLLTLPTFAQDSKSNEKTTTYYFIRHAEKDRSDKTNKDPNLIQKGLLRAAKWSFVLENIEFDAVYSTNYNRTKQTAQPTAEKKGLEVTIYDPRQLFSEEFANNTLGKTVLVVGHSNTTPAFVNAVLGAKKYDSIDDNNNANLYIVTISPSGEKSDTLLVID